MPSTTHPTISLVIGDISMARLRVGNTDEVFISLGDGAWQETLLTSSQAADLAQMLQIVASRAAPKPPASRTVTVRCTDCGHKQTVTSATMSVDQAGQPRYYFGSGYSYCDKCDGPTQETT